MSLTDSMNPPASPLRAEQRLPADAYLARVETAFEDAFSTVGRAVSLRIAGFDVAVRIAGDAIAERCLPALAARRSEPASAPDLTILAWDGAAGRIALPACPWPLEDGRVKGDMRYRGDGKIQVHFQPGCDTLSLFDSNRRLGVFWSRDARGLPAWEDASPFRTLFHWWAEAANLQMSHAAAAGTQDGAILMVGRGGSGKSTASILAAAAGLRFSGDDYVLVEPGAPPRVHGLYGTAKLDPTHAAGVPRLDGFRRLPRRDDAEKIIFDIAGSSGMDLPETQTVRAIARVRVVDAGNTEIVPATAASLLAALAPSTLLQLPQTGTASFARLAGLVRRLPCVELRMGRDFASVHGVIERFLAGLAPIEGPAPNA